MAHGREQMEKKEELSRKSSTTTFSRKSSTNTLLHELNAEQPPKIQYLLNVEFTINSETDALHVDPTLIKGQLINDKFIPSSPEITHNIKLKEKKKERKATVKQLKHIVKEINSSLQIILKDMPDQEKSNYNVKIDVSIKSYGKESAEISHGNISRKGAEAFLKGKVLAEVLTYAVGRPPEKKPKVKATPPLQSPSQEALTAYKAERGAAWMADWCSKAPLDDSKKEDNDDNKKQRLHF